MPKFLKTKVSFSSSDCNVFVAEQPSINISGEDELTVYPVFLMNEEGRQLGSMTYTIGSNHIEILELEKLDESARYVGTALVEWALFKSYELGKEGNMELTSDYGSYIFWYPLGFRSDDEEENKGIEDLIASRKKMMPEGNRLPQIKEEGDLSFTFMRLPSEAKNILLKRFQSPMNSLSINNSFTFFANEDSVGSHTTVNVGPSSQMEAFLPK